MDNPEIRRPADASRINLNEDYERRYWAEAFGVSEQRLREAVQTVGVSAEAVRQFLLRHRD
ncbi:MULTISPECIES: DUF3606 domain-containing protein [Pseudomonas]|uniref:DUF3606 domain-containing protein n=1 Tax=Pseudomonas nitroreducens TaxID=46680 RepID=A0A246F8U7_PSENT|nr:MULTISPECIES: DUF3606 domain-containing protein [Pseudomonas]MCG8907140.1 DUF3606 domain-containing protein [Pseudomonas sp. DP-17]OWP50051.1 DUF3606 domain-containing protein [Pseudomonas nitroreducens]